MWITSGYGSPSFGGGGNGGNDAVSTSHRTITDD